MKTGIKKTTLLLAIVLMLLAVPLAQAQSEELWDLQTAAEESDQRVQFPFMAQTGELAVSVRKQMDADSESVGRLERGQTLTVLGAALNEKAEVWYEVQLEDGTRGYIRSDLLMSAEEAEAEHAAYRAANEDTQGKYIGNKNSKKFHVSSCHTLPKEKNRSYFDSREEAVSKGYEPCKNCNP